MSIELTPTRKNFFRSTILFVDKLPQLLRPYYVKHWDLKSQEKPWKDNSASGANFLNELSEDQYNYLQDKPGLYTNLSKGDTAQWDLTNLSFAFDSLERSGYNILPVTHTKIIRNIASKRNQYHGHGKETKIPNKEFGELFSYMKQALKILDINAESIIELETDEFITKEYKELSKAVESLNKELEFMESLKKYVDGHAVQLKQLNADHIKHVDGVKKTQTDHQKTLEEHGKQMRGLKKIQDDHGNESRGVKKSIEGHGKQIRGVMTTVDGLTKAQAADREQIDELSSKVKQVVDLKQGGGPVGYSGARAEQETAFGGLHVTGSCQRPQKVHDPGSEETKEDVEEDSSPLTSTDSPFKPEPDVAVTSSSRGRVFLRPLPAHIQAKYNIHKDEPRYPLNAEENVDYAIFYDEANVQDARRLMADLKACEGNPTVKLHDDICFFEQSVIGHFDLLFSFATAVVVLVTLDLLKSEWWDLKVGSLLHASMTDKNFQYCLLPAYIDSKDKFMSDCEQAGVHWSPSMNSLRGIEMGKRNFKESLDRSIESVKNISANLLKK